MSNEYAVIYLRFVVSSHDLGDCYVARVDSYCIESLKYEEHLSPFQITFDGLVGSMFWKIARLLFEVLRCNSGTKRSYTTEMVLQRLCLLFCQSL